MPQHSAKWKAKKRAKTAASGTAGIARLRHLHWSSWLLLLVIVFVAILRYRLRDVSLERDEGEYAYSGQLMLQGVPPYQLAYNMKLPGTYAGYALIMALFGEDSAGIHIGVLLMTAMTSLLIFGIGRRLFGQISGAFAGMSYGLISASPAMLGLAGHATHFVVFAAAAGILILLKAIETDRSALFFLSGTCLGLAFLMKQPGLVFAAFAAVYLIHRKWQWPPDWTYLATRLGILLAGIVWPFALTCLVLYAAGVFRTFWFWTFSYARAYGARLPFALGMQELSDNGTPILLNGTGLYLIAALGLVLLFWDRRVRPHWPFIAGLLAFSSIGVSAGFFFRSHYFILLIPAVSLLTGIGVGSATEMLRDRQYTTAWVAAPALLFAAGFVITLVQEHKTLLAPDSATANRRMYPSNPFPEAREIAEYVKNNSSPDAKIVVFGSEPEIYFFSQRHSATGYIYVYSLMEDQPYAQTMQQEMIREVTRAQPDFAIFVDDGLSWFWQPGESREAFLEWIRTFVNGNYEKVAQVEIPGNPQHIVAEIPRIYLYRRRPH